MEDNSLRKILIGFLLLSFFVSCSNGKKSYTGEIKDFNKSFLEETIADSHINYFDDYKNISDLSLSIPTMPSKGKVNVLVIPLSFSDTKSTLSRFDLHEVFFSQNNKNLSTPSLREYLYYSSYGNLDLKGIVTDWIELEEKYTDFILKDLPNLFDRLMRYFTENYQTEYFTETTNIYFDSVYFIYDAPSDFQKFKDDNYPYWPHASYIINNNNLYNGLKLGRYSFIGTSHIGTTNFLSKTITAKTIIHETGHLLGLMDYYDTDDKELPVGGLGGADIMDNDFMDFNPYSKLLLGWLKPVVLTNEDTLITIKPSEAYGQALIIHQNWQNDIFSEFYVIDLYASGFLNRSRYFSAPGIRLLHADAALMPKVQPNRFHLYNNGNSSHKQIRLIEADMKFSIDNLGKNAKNESLFRSGKSFNSLDENCSFYNEALNFTMVVKKCSKTEALLEFDFA